MQSYIYISLKSFRSGWHLLPHAHTGPGALQPAQWKQRRGPYLSASAGCPFPYFPVITRNAKRYEKKDADLVQVVKKEKKDKKNKKDKDGDEETNKRKKRNDEDNAAAPKSKKPKKSRKNK